MPFLLKQVGILQAIYYNKTQKRRFRRVEDLNLECTILSTFRFVVSQFVLTSIIIRSFCRLSRCNFEKIKNIFQGLPRFVFQRFVALSLSVYYFRRLCGNSQYISTIFFCIFFRTKCIFQWYTAGTTLKEESPIYNGNFRGL